MAATKRDVEIALKARDAYSAEFDKLRDRINGVSKDVSGTVRDATTAFGNLFKTIAAGGAVSGFFSTATASVKLIRGDLEGAADAMQRLPFGIGKIFGEMRAFHDALTNIDEFTSALDAARKHSEAMFAAQQSAAVAVGRSRESVEAITTATKNRVAMLKASSEFERDRLQVLAEASAIEEKAREASAEVFRSTTEATAAARARAAALLDELQKAIALKDELGFNPEEHAALAQRIALLRDNVAQAERMVSLEEARLELSRRSLVEEKNLLQEETRLRLEALSQRHAEETEKRLAESKDAIKKRADAALDAERDRLSRIKSVESEIEQLRLRSLGKVSDAERVAITEAMRIRIDAAREAGDAELESRLRALQTARLAAIKDRPSSSSPGGITPFEARFLTRVPTSAFTTANSQEAQRIAELKAIMAQTKEVAIEQLAALEAMRKEATLIRVENN